MDSEEIRKWFSDVVQNVMIETKRDNPVSDSQLGNKWLSGFLKSRPNICKNEYRNNSTARASITEEGIKEWFEGFGNYLKERNALDILRDGERLYNADETGVQLERYWVQNDEEFWWCSSRIEKEYVIVRANFLHPEK